MNFTRRTVLATAAATGLAFSTLASAAGYPEKPVTITVGFSAGGPTDIVARILGAMTTASRGVYVLVGLAALYSIYLCVRKLPAKS